MRIHTNNLGRDDLSQAFDDIRTAAPNVTLNIVSEHGSQRFKQAFEVNLRGHGARHTRPPQTGERGERAATRDDWGWFISAIYSAERGARVGPYKSREHFHTETKNAYQR